MQSVLFFMQLVWCAEQNMRQQRLPPVWDLLQQVEVTPQADLALFPFHGSPKIHGAALAELAKTSASDSEEGAKTESGFSDCANENAFCECKGGEVRFGGEQFTPPVKVGERDGIDCDIASLRRLRVPLDVDDLNEHHNCECNVRKVYIYAPTVANDALLQEWEQSFKLDIGTEAPEGEAAGATEAATEDAGATEAAPEDAGATEAAPGTTGTQPAAEDPVAVTAQDPVAVIGPNAQPSSSGLNGAPEGAEPASSSSADESSEGGTAAPAAVEVDLEGQSCLAVATAADLEEEQELLGMASGLRMRPCQKTEEFQWTYYLGSKHLRDASTGECLTAVLDAETDLRMEPCERVETATKTQRWEIPFYHTTDFTEGKGLIRLERDGHTLDKAQCLFNFGSGVNLVHCRPDSDKTMKMATANGPHHWVECAGVDGTCACEGEVRFANEDKEEYTAGVGVFPEAGITCTIDALQTKAFPDLTGGTNTCQCRKDKWFSSDDAFNNDKSLEDAKEEKANGSPMTSTFMIIVWASSGVVIALLLVSAYMWWKKKRSGLDEELWGEEEEWAGEEWEGEGEEWEEGAEEG